MNPYILMELSQIKEQENMRAAERRAAVREARRESGVSWLQMLRSRLVAIRRTRPAARPAARPAPATEC